MKKNKVIGIISIIALLSILIVSGTSAYLTSTDTINNTFTIGNVKIKILEPTWQDEEVVDTDDDGIPDFAENIVPNNTIPKDPQIENIGENDAYVYMKVTIPAKKIITAAKDGKILNNGEAVDTPLFTYDIDSNWTEITSAIDTTTNDSDEVTEYIHVYYYNKKIEKGEKTTALFNSVTFANIIDGQLESLSSCNIKIDAYAIQSDNLQVESIEEAYAVYMNQNNL